MNTIFDSLQNDYKIHRKSRTEKHAHYPHRFFVPDNKVFWQYNFPEYKPVKFNDPVVLDKNTSWADPQELKEIKRNFLSFEGEVKLTNDGIPLNPIGRTGIEGRGILGKWGANYAADGLITRLHPESSLFQVLTIIRKDTGEIAIPGGMIDPGEDSLKARNRELAEELSIKKEDLEDALYESEVSKGYVDDPRNTDNAWIETTVIHTHLMFEKAENMIIQAGDDAKDYAWTDVTNENLGNYYANHGLSLLIALNKLIGQHSPFVNEQAISLFKENFGNFSR
jgi:ADP-ribose pyrophosphatase